MQHTLNTIGTVFKGTMRKDNRIVCKFLPFRLSQFFDMKIRRVKVM